MHHAIVLTNVLWIWYTNVWYIRYVTIPENMCYKIQSQRTHRKILRQTGKMCQIVSQNMPNDFNKHQAGWKNLEVCVQSQQVFRRFFSVNTTTKVKKMSSYDIHTHAKQHFRMINHFSIRPGVCQSALKCHVDNPDRLPGKGQLEIFPIWTNMLIHLKKGMQVAIQWNSTENFILFVLEKLIYTRIIFDRAHLTSSCSPNLRVNLLHFVGRNPSSKLISLVSCLATSFTHLLTLSEREKSLNTKAIVTYKDLPQLDKS